ncbi:MAG: hypothetical protein HFI34_06805 [Lachnospiraceae bacterium]|nr:hypothetical protein [Lachnospiraceae bacterium]
MQKSKEEKPIERLSLEEQKNIMKAIYAYINSNDFVNGELQFETLDKDGTSIGLFSEQGARYLEKNILGEYKGLLPFTIHYRSNPTTDEMRLKMVEEINDLTEWIEKNADNVKLALNRIVEKIEGLTTPYLSQADDAGNITYSVNFNFIYRKEC